MDGGWRAGEAAEEGGDREVAAAESVAGWHADREKKGCGLCLVACSSSEEKKERRRRRKERGVKKEKKKKEGKGKESVATLPLLLLLRHSATARCRTSHCFLEKD